MKKAKLEHSDTRIMAHEKSECEGHPCPLHHRTKHAMRAFPQHWRDDRGFMERICPHGIGHPDPDQWGFLVIRFGKKYAAAEFVHGCDLCCTRSTDVVPSKDDTSRATK